MKRKKGKWNLLLTVLVTASVLLGGCGKDGKGGESSGEPADRDSTQQVSQSAEGELAELEEKTIQIWLLGPGKQKDSEEVWEKFNEMLQDYVPNTTVEFTVIPAAEYVEKFNQMLASEEAIDLAWIGFLQGDLNLLTADGNLMPMDDLLAQYGQGITETLGQEVMELHKYKDGRNYYVINWQGLCQGSWGYRVPTELAQLAGDSWLEDTRDIVYKWWNTDSSLEDYQAVFDQFDQYFSALQQEGKLYGGMGAPLFHYGRERFSTIGRLNLNNVGVTVRDRTFTVIDGIQSDYFRIYAKNVAEFYNKGYIRSDIASVDPNALTFITDGEYTSDTLVAHVHGALGEATAVQESAKAGVDVSIIQIEEKPYVSTGSSTAVAIPYCSDEPERAVMVLNELYTNPELYQLLIYGIEGKHYTDNGDGTITTPYGSQGNADCDYGLWKWTVGTCMNSLVTQTDTPGYYEELKSFEEDAYIDYFVGFVFDTSKVNSILTSLDAIDEEYGDMIYKGYRGDAWEETLDKWIAERKAVGVDALIEEYQAQLDAYIEENHITVECLY